MREDSERGLSQTRGPMTRGRTWIDDKLRPTNNPVLDLWIKGRGALILELCQTSTAGTNDSAFA